MKCRLCSNEVNQTKTGSGGIEIGFAKWFQTIEPWMTIIIICYDCFWKVAEKLELSEFDQKAVLEQKPK